VGHEISEGAGEGYVGIDGEGQVRLSRRRNGDILGRGVRDVSCGRGRGVGEIVVAGVGAADADAAHRYRFAGAHGSVGERRRRVAVGQGVAGDLVIGQGDRGRGGAVLYLVDAGGRDRQAPGGDVGRARGRGRGQ